jgi:hypothetical protein
MVIAQWLMLNAQFTIVAPAAQHHDATWRVPGPLCERQKLSIALS